MGLHVPGEQFGEGGALGGPQGLFTAKFEVSSRTVQANQVAAADLDGDGDVDVVSMGENANALRWHERRGGERVGIVGASGYTGADLVRLALRHPAMRITALTANSHAGKTMAEVFPHLAFDPLPPLTTVEEADWSAVDAVFCGLPHGTTQEIAKTILGTHPGVKFIDMSAEALDVKPGRSAAIAGTARAQAAALGAASTKLTPASRRYPS